MSSDSISFGKGFDHDYLNEISSLAKIGGWRYLKDGNQSWVSDQVYAIYGFDAGEKWRISEGIEHYIGESRKKIEESFKKLLEDGTPYDLVLAFQNARKENLWVRTKGIPICDGDQIVGAWGILQDITDFFLLESEHDFIQSFTSELHIILREWKIIELNDGWSRVTGYGHEEAIGKDWVDFLHPEDRQRGEAIRQLVLKEKHLTNLPVRCIHKDGQTIYLSINARVAPDDETIFAIARDVTDIKLHEQELQESLVKVKAANLAKSQFLMMMSHELRTPLNPIVAFTDMLMHQVKDEGQQEMLKLIKDSADHLAHLLSEILDISSIETGKMKILKEPVDMIAILQSTFNIMLPKAKDKGLHVDLDLGESDDLESMRKCIGDKRKIRQILFNLINNAIKFTQTGSISVGLLKPVIEESSVRVTVTVEDTGIGIEQEHQSKIFEAFHQVQMTETREYGGQGLGLALSRKLARLMGGDITVESTHGSGSCFTLTLSLETAG